MFVKFELEDYFYRKGLSGYGLSVIYRGRDQFDNDKTGLFISQVRSSRINKVVTIPVIS